MSLTVQDRKPTAEQIARCGWTSHKGGQLVTLEGGSHRRHGHHQRRVYFDRDGRAFIRDRFKAKRYITACRFLVVDGKPLDNGCVVLEARP